jgi:hypothetical protein
VSLPSCSFVAEFLKPLSRSVEVWKVSLTGVDIMSKPPKLFAASDAALFYKRAAL